MEDAPSVTTAIAQHLFLITEIDTNVNIRNIESDAQTVNGGIFRNSEGFALNTGIADGIAGIAEDISHVLVEPEIVLADRNVRVASQKTSIAGRNTREADRNVRVARVKTCIADGNIRVADRNISAEDARLIGFENNGLLNRNTRNFGATVAQFPGTSCCDEILNEKGKQGPVHSEHSGENLASETCLSVTGVNITHTEKVELCYNSSEGDKVNCEIMEKLDLWNVFKELTDEYLEGCRETHVEVDLNVLKNDRFRRGASSKMKNCSESSDDEYLDAEGTHLTDYESTSPTESDYLSDLDNSDCEPKFRRMRSQVSPRGDLTHSPDSQCHTSNPITVFQTEEVAEDADLTYFDLIKPGPDTLPLEEHFKLDHLEGDKKGILLEVIASYQDVFLLPGTPLGCTHLATFKVNLDTDVPIFRPPYRLPALN